VISARFPARLGTVMSIGVRGMVPLLRVGDVV